MSHFSKIIAQKFASLTGRAEPEGAIGVEPLLHGRTIMRRQEPAPVKQEVVSQLQILCPDPTAEDTCRQAHIETGQRLARQDRWDELSAVIRKADEERALTPGAMPVADLISYGARADVVMAVEHALLGGTPDRDAPLLDGIEALEHVAADHPDDYVIATIVAQTHLDIGWAWRGTGWDVEISAINREAFDAHVDRASDILEAFCKKGLNSAFLATTCCAVLSGAKDDKEGLAQKYETLIDLNPANPRPMRAMGNYLLPRWNGSHDKLELEARRTAARTIDVWGAGAYTWVMFDAITYDDEACAALDLDFFIEGMHDILTRSDDAYTVNLLAAYCANAMGQTFSGNDEADQNRARIAHCAGWIVRDHLTELHPMIWAHAAQGFDNNLRVHSPERFAASGREDAMRIITGLFRKEIAAGKRIVFTDTGPEALPA